jgi:hypothetical protein
MAEHREQLPHDGLAFAGWAASRVVALDRRSASCCMLHVATEAVLSVHGAPGVLWPHRARSQGWRAHPRGTALEDLARALAPSPPPRLRLRLASEDPATFHCEFAVLRDPGGTGPSDEPSLPGIDVTSPGQPTRRLVVRRDPFGVALLSEEDGEHGGRKRVLLDGAGQLTSALGTRLAPTVLTTKGRLEVAFALGPDEVLLGLGERAGPWILNGTSVRARISDAMGTGTGMTYKAAPVLHSSKGWTLVAESEQDVTVDAGLRAAGIVVLSVDTEELAFTLFAQPRLRDRLAALARRTGRPQRPPAFAIGKIK